MHGHPHLVVANVITSNDYTWFGYVEDPKTAHTTYYMDKDVLKLIFGGSARSVYEGNPGN